LTQVPNLSILPPLMYIDDLKVKFALSAAGSMINFITIPRTPGHLAKNPTMETYNRGVD
ncbi:hypothetical protein H0H87_011903, partial [Tephrocybe sp. NHM501043]